MHGAHRPVVALAHRVEHRDDLVAADLADDHAVGVHAQAHADEVRCGHFARALDIRFACFERHAVGVHISETVEAQLQLGLDRHDPFRRGDLRCERAQHRRLPRTCRTRHDDLLTRAHRSGQERCEALVDRPETDQVREVELHEAMPADRDRRSSADPRDGEQA